MIVRGGFLRDAALINVRFVEFLLQDWKDTEQAKHYMKESLRYFKEWGTIRSTEMLQFKDKDLFATPTSLSTDSYAIGAHASSSIAFTVVES